MKPTFLILLACAPLGTLAANDAALQRCRGLADATTRLACYDAIALPAALTPAAATNAGPATLAALPVASFGLETRPAPAAGPAPLTAMDSAIDGAFDGWLPNSVLKLANGQSWQIADGSTAAYRLRNPKVQVKRGVSGSFFMAVEGVVQTPRVRRVQ